MRVEVDPVIPPRLVIWALVAGLVTYTVADPDLWGHVRFGQDILNERVIPATDPYSFTTDRPWVNHEWLSEVLMAAAYNAAGPVGLSVLKLTLLLAAFALLAYELRANGVPPVASDVLVAICVVSCMTLSRTLRPQTFSFALFALLLVILRRVEDRSTALIWTLPLVMMLWANLHGGWLVGIGVMAVWAGVRVVAPRGPSRSVWAAGALASLVATLATPEGTRLWAFLYETVGFGRADITEWQSLTRLSVGDAVPWTLTTIVAVVALWRVRDQRLSHVAVVAMMLLASFRVWRLAPFYALAGIVLLGPHTLRAAPTAASRGTPPGWAALAVVGIMTVLAGSAAAVTSYRNVACIKMSGDWIADREAAAFIKSAGLRGRMLTWFDWGEYAIWAFPDIRVSMDGRRETVYSDEMLRRHYAIYRGEAGWQDDLRRIDPEHIWLPASVPTLDEMKRLGWHRVLRTERSEILSRLETQARPLVTAVIEECFPGAP